MDGQTALSKIYKWKRSENGIVAGVCRGLAESFKVDIWLIRILWLIATLWFGVGLVLYFILAISLPRADRLDHALDSKFLGVCARMAVRFDVEVGVVRSITCLFATSTFGLVMIGYVIGYFVFPRIADRK